MKLVQNTLVQHNPNNASIFDSNQKTQQSSFVVEEDQLKPIEDQDNISIYLQESAKCKTDDNDEDSFIVQQLSQSSHISTNQLQQQAYINNSQQYQQSFISNQKRKTIKKLKKVQKGTKLSSQEKNKSRKYRSGRKIRISINEDKFQLMQRLFETNQKEKLSGEPKKTLKQISLALDLGYSTVLHKYRQYRQTGIVQKGVLLECKDIKRKYKKSQEIQSKIVEALKANTFNTAIQLSKFIFQNYGLKISRSIVSRHLNQMKNQRKDLNFFRKRVNKALSNDSQVFKKYPSSQAQKQKQNKLLYEGELTYFHQFRKFILTLREQKKPVYFIQSFHIVLIDGTIFFQSDLDEFLSSYTDFKVLMISFTSDGKDIIDSNFQVLSSCQASRCSQLFQYFIYVYAQERMYQLKKIVTHERKCFLVYNYRADQNQKIERQKLYRFAENNQVDLIFMPPETQDLNFIQKWFYQNVFQAINMTKFTSSQSLIENIKQISLMKNSGLKQYSAQMFSRINNFN